MNILITGGAGFIGSKIAKDLHSKGHDIFVVDDLSNGLESRLDRENWYCYNYNLKNRFMLDEIFDSRQFDLVIHCAAQIDVRRSIDNPLFDCDSNIYQSIVLLEAMIAGECNRIIFLSSAGALYDLNDGECCATEDSRINPLCPYGVSKRAFELYLEYYKHQHGIKPTILRLANVYGRDNIKGVCRIFADRARKGEDLVVNGGEQVRDFVHVDDVVSAVNATLHREGIFNVGTGEGVDMIELAKMVQAEFDSDGKSKLIRNPLIKGEVMRSVINPQRLFRLGWKPSVSLSDGLKTVYNC